MSDPTLCCMRSRQLQIATRCSSPMPRHQLSARLRRSVRIRLGPLWCRAMAAICRHVAVGVVTAEDSRAERREQQAEEAHDEGPPPQPADGQAPLGGQEDHAAPAAAAAAPWLQACRPPPPPASREPPAPSLAAPSLRRHPTAAKSLSLSIRRASCASASSAEVSEGPLTLRDQIPATVLQQVRPVYAPYPGCFNLDLPFTQTLCPQSVQCCLHIARRIDPC